MREEINTHLDFDSHPAQLVKPGMINPEVGVKQLREAIPEHCFKSSYSLSLYYLLRDSLLARTLALVAFRLVPNIGFTPLRWVAWASYGYIQGLVCTGIWVLGHECGHMAFFPSRYLNDAIGFILHSSLLTPYFAWQSTHRRHHIYANNLAKDHNYVPPVRETYASSLLLDVQKLEELTEDSPLIILTRIILQQVLGFPWYLLTNITASPGSLHREKSTKWLGNSHFLPWSTLFRPEEAHLILISNLGIGYRVDMVLLLYLQPYMWVNHWFVAITYLHHTHPKLPKYENEAWTFLRGATATVDRDFGWIGKYMFHGVIEFHVIHHLFSRIPFYHAEEATNAIIPLLGDSYHAEKSGSYIYGIWESFTKCQWIEPDKPDAEPKDRAMWYKAGPSPPPETSMGRKAWII
ncbi:delta-12 fatty acid desaturas-like protein [Clohesyomyces aquaticus]|uniref:Delta-12 fatty acid desaturas-like protein n=1 Tax=Clohesyomyces aquaticus TaxID=1231657 RepID=A0A1Y1Z5Y9_9PLEO|nr:delta-12 fatty acid desaturas-like protein [Clohesyomyces aquaticus]